MKVYVVVTDCGLNGPIVHGVYSAPPGAEDIQEFVNARRVTPDGAHYRVASLTGYQFTETHVIDLDGPLQ